MHSMLLFFFFLKMSFTVMSSNLMQKMGKKSKGQITNNKKKKFKVYMYVPLCMECYKY